MEQRGHLVRHALRALHIIHQLMIHYLNHLKYALAYCGFNIVLRLF